MLYQGIIGRGSSPVEPVDLSPVLLWTNPSPGTEFAAQTVSLDLSEYAGVIVEFNANTNTSNYPTCTRVFCKKSDPEYFGGGAVPASGALGRTLRITNEGVFFGNGFSAASTANDTAIPTKIYGVKEYVVDSNISAGTITSGKTVNCNIGDLIVIFVTDTKEFNTLVKSGAESLQMSSNISAIGNFGYMEIVKATSEVVTLNSDYSYYSVISI